MGVVILAAVLIVAGTLGSKYIDYYKQAILNICSLVSILIGSCIGFIAIVFILTKEPHKTIAKKEFIELQLKDSTLSDIERIVVLMEAQEINDKILENKLYINNKWINLFFSKDVSNLDYIKFNR